MMIDTCPRAYFADLGSDYASYSHLFDRNHAIFSFSIKIMQVSQILKLFWQIVDWY